MSPELERVRRHDSREDGDYFDDVCPNCGGEGYVLRDCDEDTCCCADPEESHGYKICEWCTARGR